MDRPTAVPSRRRRLFDVHALLALLLTAADHAVAAVAARGDPLVLVADTRHLKGWQSWWLNLYNESHLGFALLTIVVVPSVALLIGRLVEYVLSRAGINLKSRVLAEH